MEMVVSAIWLAKRWTEPNTPFRLRPLLRTMLRTHDNPDPDRDRDPPSSWNASLDCGTPVGWYIDEMQVEVVVRGLCTAASSPFNPSLRKLCPTISTTTGVR